MALRRALSLLLLWSAPAAAGVELHELSRFAPPMLGKAKREHVEEVAIAHVLDARYRGERDEIHLNIGTVDDPKSAQRFYDRDYPTKKASRHMRVHQRHYTESGGRSTSEACVLIRDAVNVCVAVSPSTREEDALRYLDAVDLPGLLELAVRSGAPAPFPGTLTFTADEKQWRTIEDGIRANTAPQLKSCALAENRASKECVELAKSRADCRPGRFEGGLLESDIELTAAERKNFHHLWLLTCKVMGKPVADSKE